MSSLGAAEKYRLAVGCFRHTAQHVTHWVSHVSQIITAAERYEDRYCVGSQGDVLTQDDDAGREHGYRDGDAR